MAIITEKNPRGAGRKPLDIPNVTVTLRLPITLVSEMGGKKGIKNYLINGPQDKKNEPVTLVYGEHRYNVTKVISGDNDQYCTAILDEIK